MVVQQSPAYELGGEEWCGFSTVVRIVLNPERTKEHIDDASNERTYKLY